MKSVRKMAGVALFGLMALEAGAAESQASDKSLLGLAVRSDSGTFLLSDKVVPLGNVPMNIFALFEEQLGGEVQMHLRGPSNHAVRAMAEPYGLFEDISFKSLPSGPYELHINVVNAQGLVEQRHVVNFTLSDPQSSGSAAL
jgi:hypothetical protein